MTRVRFLAIIVVLLFLAACGSTGSGGSLPAGVLIETVAPTGVATPGSQASGQTATGGVKPADPPASAATAVPTPDGSTPTQAPTTGHWIDVDVTNFAVHLMNGTQVLQTIGPVAVGAQVDTGAYESTQTGLYHVYNKIPGLQYDAPYKAYISDWVAFDPNKDNGFHSFLQDSTGAVTDASTGRVSNGCIRTGDSSTIYTFAEIGMPVLVHY